MSFNNSPTLEDVPSSNHSLFTPSYTADVLVPIRCQELDLEPSLPVAPKILAKEAYPTKPKKSVPSPKTRDPIQYQKLKMNYLRRLNVVPIVSQKDVLAVLGKEQSKEQSKSSKLSFEGGKPSKTFTEKSNKTSKKTSEKPFAIGKKDSNKNNEKHFTPSFLPTKGMTSKPIAIPPRSYSKKLTDLSLYEELEKGELSSLPSSTHTGSIIPDHFGVFFGDF